MLQYSVSTMSKMSHDNIQQFALNQVRPAPIDIIISINNFAVCSVISTSQTLQSQLGL